MSTPTTAPLTPADMEIMEFARIRFAPTQLGRKDTAIFDRFGDTPTRFSQRLLAVLAKPAALAYDPELVHREERLAADRKAHRTAATRLVGGR